MSIASICASMAASRAPDCQKSVVELNLLTRSPDTSPSSTPPHVHLSSLAHVKARDRSLRGMWPMAYLCIRWNFLLPHSTLPYPKPVY
ncbi:hypothetical protein BYT27DRAFT_6741365 [Phlegmacium glaucopus]|nr:hypothetical protein BYT27DRAFT_6741365 [Phlegmacium glaucopus]